MQREPVQDDVRTESLSTLTVNVTRSLHGYADIAALLHGGSHLVMRSRPRAVPQAKSALNEESNVTVGEAAESMTILSDG